MDEYICVISHCGDCKHFCVRSPLFEKKLEKGEINKTELSLDGLIHKFEKKNHFFFNTSNVLEVSKEEMIRFARLGDKLLS